MSLLGFQGSGTQLMDIPNGKTCLLLHAFVKKSRDLIDA